MILVLLGTQKHDFSRLLKAIEIKVNDGLILDQVIVQNGYTKIESKKMELIGFISNDELDKLITKADIVICHGGAGSIFKCLELGKIVIALARSKQYREHFNDHQSEIVDRLSEMRYLIKLEDICKIDEYINNSGTFTPIKFVSNTERMIENIKSFIDD